MGLGWCSSEGFPPSVGGETKGTRGSERPHGARSLCPGILECLGEGLEVLTLSPFLPGPSALSPGGPGGPGGPGEPGSPWRPWRHRGEDRLGGRW